MARRPTRFTNLSEEQRRLFEAALRAKGIDRSEPEAIPAVPEGEAAPLSFAQRRLWFFEQLAPDTPAYNDVYGIRFRGVLDAACLRRALDALLARHDALRATFALEGAEPVQRTAPPAPVGLAVVDLDAADGPGGVDDALDRVAREGAAERFDLERGPLVRARLVRVANDDHVLMLFMHHIVSDGQSFMILFRDLADLYAAHAEGRPAKGPRAALRYVDHAAWERGRVTREAAASEVSWWTERLAPPLPEIRLPLDAPRPARQGFRGAGESHALTPALSEALGELCRRRDVTVFMAVLAAFQVLLRRWGATDDSIVGSPIATRSDPRTRELVGLFVNTLVVRTDLSGNPTFAELLGRVKASCHEAYEHHAVPFDEIVRALGMPRDLSRNPLFQAFVLQDTLPGPREPVPGLAMQHQPLDNGFVRADLALWVLDEGGLMGSHSGGSAGGKSLSLRLQYERDLFRPETIAAIMRQVVRTLELALEDDGRRLGELASALDALEQDERAGAARSRKAGARKRLQAARRVAVRPAGGEGAS